MGKERERGAQDGRRTVVGPGDRSGGSMGGEGDAVYLSESLGVDKNGKAFNAIEPNRR